MGKFSVIVVLACLAFAVQSVNASRSNRCSPWARDVYYKPQMSYMCVQKPFQVRRVFENHFKQLGMCSVEGLKRERTPQTQLFFGASLIKGEKAVDQVFIDTCKPRSEGGFRGIQFKEINSFVVGNVISVKWVATAPFLREPYGGSDAYVTCGNKMLTIVSSFDPNELKFKDE